MIQVNGNCPALVPYPYVWQVTTLFIATFIIPVFHYFMCTDKNGKEIFCERLRRKRKTASVKKKEYEPLEEQKEKKKRNILTNLVKMNKYFVKSISRTLRYKKIKLFLLLVLVGVWIPEFVCFPFPPNTTGDQNRFALVTAGVFIMGLVILVNPGYVYKEEEKIATLLFGSNKKESKRYVSTFAASKIDLEQQRVSSLFGKGGDKEGEEEKDPNKIGHFWHKVFAGMESIWALVVAHYILTELDYTAFSIAALVIMYYSLVMGIYTAIYTREWNGWTSNSERMFAAAFYILVAALDTAVQV